MRGAMHAQLGCVRPVSGSSASQVACRRRAELRPITFHVVTAGWPVRIGLHPPAAGLVEAPERQVDAAFVRVRPAFDHRPVGLADPAALEQPAEIGQRLAVAAEHQAAGGVAVEPVGQRRRARQAEAQRVEIVLQALAALRPAMDREAGRLVDHQHQAVAIEQASHHLFRCHLCVHRRNRYHGRRHE